MVFETIAESKKVALGINERDGIVPSMHSMQMIQLNASKNTGTTAWMVDEMETEERIT